MESLLDTTAGCYEREPGRAPVSPGCSGELKRCHVHLPSTSPKTGAGRMECSAFRAGPATDRSRGSLGASASCSELQAPEAKRVGDLFQRAPGSQRAARPGRRRAVPPQWRGSRRPLQDGRGQRRRRRLGFGRGMPRRRIRPTGIAHARPRDTRSSLQLLLQLVEESPIGALRDQALRRRLDHSRLTEPEGIEADGILRVVDAPLVVRNIL
jgi:hypothetical protein